MTTETAPPPAPPNVDDVPDEVRKAAAKSVAEAKNRKAAHDLKFFARTVTQGEWLTVTRGLDMSREQIGDDNNLTMLALAYIKEKREHRAASWDVLFELTDEALLEFHGFTVDGLLDDEDNAEDAEAEDTEV